MRRNCDTSGCCNRAAKGRKICWTCKSAKAKKVNPIGYFFNVHRKNARRRGIEFTITIEDFREFCFEYEFMSKKGRSVNSYTLDRIDPMRGYVPGNIQRLTLKENALKKKVKYDHFSEKKFSTVTVRKFSSPPLPKKRSRWIRQTISSLLTKQDVPF